MHYKIANITLNRKNTFLVLAIFFALFSILLTNYSYHSHSNRSKKSEISYFIDLQFFTMFHIGSEIQNSIANNENKINWKKLGQIPNLHGFICFIYQSDTLRYWNTHTVDQANPQIFNSQGDTILKLNNGIYLLHQTKFENWSINILNKIQSNYEVENDLLETKITDQLKTNGQISLFSSYERLKPKDSLIEKEGIFKLVYSPTKNTHESGSYQILLISFPLLFFLFMVIWLIKVINDQKLKGDKHWIATISLTIIITILSTGLIHFLQNYYPPSINFVAQISPITFFRSSGEIITNLFVGWLLLLMVINQIEHVGLRLKQPIKFAVLFGITVLTLTFCYNLLFHLILDNDYSLELESMFSKTTEWHIVTIIWLINAIAFTLLTVVSHITFQKTTKYTLLIVAIASLLLIWMISSAILRHSALVVWMAITSVSIIQLCTKKNHSKIVSAFMILVVTAGISAFQINKAQLAKSSSKQKFTATMLAQKNDPLMEFQFVALKSKMIADSTLINLMHYESTIDLDSIDNYIKTQYLDSAFSKFNVQITICDETDFLDIPGESNLISCNQYFEDLINNSGETIYDSTLFTINNTTENIYYLGIIDFVDKRTIFLEFVSSYVPEGLGYPELIIDKKAQTFNLANTSYARYYDNALGYKFGDYKYPIVRLQDNNDDSNSGFSYNNGYQHYTIDIDENEMIITSVPSKSLSEILFPFSILFLLFTISAAVAYLLIFAFNNREKKIISFRTKLQFFIIGTIIFTTVLLALITMLFMQDNAETSTQKQLEEKTYSVFIELQHKLGHEVDFSESENIVLENLLKKFSLVFFSDINLYTPEGLLAATSRPEMEQKGLLSNMINPEAYKALMIDHQLSFITKEKIGKLTFYSAYLPLFLSENKPAAIINLPFFARQSEIVRTFASLLANFINIAVLIAILGTIFSIILSRLLTKPLLMLQQRMADIHIDRPNRSIFWKNNDEIGQLIEQYNRMVEKLEISAELLKDSERENTWREMARQIAHEIKNPLTPMKLNVQYLEKAYIEKAPDFKTRLTRTTKSLIEQIETLNNVAEMFGEVATPKPKTQELINVKDLITDVVELFDNNPEIKFITDFTPAPCYIEAVKKDMLRVMNNLVKNAVQSFTFQSNKTITINCNCINSQVFILITDNGKGISSETKKNIFRPYFTTKTSGTGLGLAIVKSIVNENNGRISFTSNIGKGSTFTLSFPTVN